MTEIQGQFDRDSGRRCGIGQQRAGAAEHPERDEDADRQEDEQLDHRFGRVARRNHEPRNPWLGQQTDKLLDTGGALHALLFQFGNFLYVQIEGYNLVPPTGQSSRHIGAHTA